MNQNEKDYLLSAGAREIARKAVEDELIVMRDSHLSMPMRNNGCTIKEKDGSPSNIIRFGVEDAFYIGLKAIFETIPDKL